MQSNIRKFFPIIILILLAIGTFGRTYFNDFLGIDDHVYIWDNPHIRDGLTIEGIKWAFQAGLTDLSGFADYWQPMTFLSRMVDISLFEFKAGMHHLTNLFFHCINIALLYVLLRKLTQQCAIAFFVTAFFALHPLQAEILGWVTARKDVLSLFFGLITMHVYIRGKDAPSVINNILLAFCFALSLMAKPMMITLPILLLFIDAWKTESNDGLFSFKHWWPLLLNKWPLFLMIVLYLPIPFLGQPQAFEFQLNHPIARGIAGYSFYLGKLLWPANLSLYGPIPEIIIPVSKIILSAALIVSVTALCTLLFKRDKAILAGWLWFMVACLPIVSLPVADRFMYMPMIGFWLAVLSILNLAVKNKRALKIFLLSVSVAYIVLSFKQVALWKDNKTVLHHALTYSNENYAAHNVLGAVYGNEKDFPSAIEHLHEAIRIKPDRDKPYNNIGRILEMQGKPGEALEYYEKSLALKPGDFRTVSNIGIIYIRQGDMKKGIEFLERALKSNPKVKGLQNNLAIAYYKEGNIEKAEQLARQFQSAYAYNQFGIFEIQNRNYRQAEQYFREALSLNPTYEESIKNLSHLKNMLNQQP